MTAHHLLVISRRFRGPPTSGNGGYTCGMLAAAASKPVEVRLIRPPPLDRTLEIVEDRETSGLLLKDGAEVVASATPKTFELEVPKAPSYAEALAAVSHYEGFQEHAYSDCFVCGPARYARRRHADLCVAHRGHGPRRRGLDAGSLARRGGRQGAAGVHVGGARLPGIFRNGRRSARPAARHLCRAHRSLRTTSIRPASSSAGRSSTTGASTSSARRSSTTSASFAAARSRPGSSRGRPSAAIRAAAPAPPHARAGIPSTA